MGSCVWTHLECNATDGIHFIELRVIHAQMTSFGLWPATPAGRVGRKRSRECRGMNKLIQVAPEWMSPRMMANESLLCRMRKCDMSDGTAAELLNSMSYSSAARLSTWLSTHDMHQALQDSCPKSTNVVYYFLVTL